MSNILKHADQIINERSEEKERQYGPFMECNQKAAEIASVITGKPLTALDVSWVQVAVKWHVNPMHTRRTISLTW